ncbi:MAG: YciI family protein [Gemmatimonadales bacterium]
MTPEELDGVQSELERLNPELSPPAGLESRVMRTLESRNLIRRRRPRLLMIVGSLAAGILLFLGGVLAGRGMASPAQAGHGPRFMLLLYEDAGFHRDGEPPESFVAEYSGWGHRLAESGREVSGEELAPSARLLAPADSGSTVAARDVGSTAGQLAGFFIISARDYADAVSVARTHPHLRHGGRVVVREVM